MSFTASYIYNTQTSRELEPSLYWIYDRTDPNAISDAGYAAPTIPDGKTGHAIQYAPTGPWSPLNHTHAFRLGVRIWK